MNHNYQGAIIKDNMNSSRIFFFFFVFWQVYPEKCRCQDTKCQNSVPPAWSKTCTHKCAHFNKSHQCWLTLLPRTGTHYSSKVWIHYDSASVSEIQGRVLSLKCIMHMTIAKMKNKALRVLCIIFDSSPTAVLWRCMNELFMFVDRIWDFMDHKAHCLLWVQIMLRRYF